MYNSKDNCAFYTKFIYFVEVTMSFLTDYPVFVSGRFFDREGRIKAHVDKDHLVRAEYEGKIVGRIKNGKLYDETMNYVGYFKDGILYSFGGNIIGYCNGWKIDDAKEGEPINCTIGWIATIAGLGYLVFKIMRIFLLI